MKKTISIIVCVVGLLLCSWGVMMKMPGTYLTTYESLDGDYSDYADAVYNSIEEYVGGDAYNYIIGASLVGGEISGAMTQKAIFVVGGAMIASIGAISFAYSKKDESPVIQQETKID